jgi:hypothetical protein
MGWWPDSWKQRADQWTYVELNDDQVPDGVTRHDISPDTSYVSVFLRSMRVTRIRRGTNKFYGAVHSYITLPHLSGDIARFHVFTAPNDLKNIDAAHLDRFLSLNQRLLGPVPYRGGDLDIEAGLFSIKSVDFVSPFLNVVESVASAAGVAFVQVAAPFVNPLLQAVNLLAGAQGDSILEIGLGRVFNAPQTGYYLIMQSPKGTVQPANVRVDKDYQLVTNDGAPIDDYPYMLLCIEAKPQRDDWFMIPQLSAAYEDLKLVSAKGWAQVIKDAEAAFSRTAFLSPDLIQSDAERIIKLVKGEVDHVTLQTAFGGITLPDFKDLPLYGP